MLPKIQVSYNPNALSQPITDSEYCTEILRKIWKNDLIHLQELVYVLFINGSNQAIGYRCMHMGTCNGVLIDVKLLIGLIGACQSSKIIIAHNHPSGRIKPSLKDINVTKRVIDACRLIEVDVLDHIILTADAYYSFKDNGLIREC